MANKTKASTAPAKPPRDGAPVANGKQKRSAQPPSEKKPQHESSSSDNDDDDDDDDAEPLELDIDNFGRPHGVVGTLDYSFRSVHSALRIPDDKSYVQLVQDCETAFTARAIENAEYSTGTTFFLPATMEPRCLLERMAREVFDFHTRDVKEFDAAKSGAEWWTLVLDSGETNDDVAFHWDRDYGLEDQYNVNLHPHVGTVTYLSDIGGPTVVLDKVSPVQTGADDCGAGEITAGYISRPVLGKHISFDGRLLHGAPGDLADVFSMQNGEQDDSGSKKRKRDAKSIQNGRRVTFLVNVWLNHKPIDSDPFPEDDLEKLTCIATTPITFNLADAEVHTQKPEQDICSITTSEAVKEGGEEAIDTLNLSFKEANRNMTLLLPVPVKSLQQQFRKTPEVSSFAVQFDEGNRAVLVAGDEVDSNDEEEDSEEDDSDEENAEEGDDDDEEDDEEDDD